MINQVNIVGNLGAAPEVRSTASGTKVCSLRVAVSERVKQHDGQWVEKTHWLTVVAWAQQADFVERFLAKGSRVFATGRLAVREWEDRQSGQKRSTVEIVAERIMGLDRKGERGEERPPQNAGSSQRAPAQGGADEFFDDDVPF